MTTRSLATLALLLATLAIAPSTTTAQEPIKLGLVQGITGALEVYAKRRNHFRAEVMDHKQRRIVHLGDHVTLIFEDEITIRYQIQEMLRIERTFEEQGIQDELDAYNPLIPDGTNLKATMLIEYEDPEQRQEALARALYIYRHDPETWRDLQRTAMRQDYSWARSARGYQQVYEWAIARMRGG